MEDLNVAIYGVVKIGGIEVWITQTMVGAWIISAVLILFAVVVRIKSSKFNEIPKGFQNVIESIVEAFDNFAKGAVDERLMFLGNWYFMVFAFILLSNISGLFFFRPPTADWSLTLTFALVTFALIQVMGVKFQKGTYIKGLFAPHPLFFPLNVIGELARPISLSFRLFGNILAGTILMSLLYSLAPVFLRFLAPIPLHGFFDLFAGALQAFVFCVLSLSFINFAASSE
ncbi:MAG: F0F1 ATP synthase subunit A [Oscillospiraceae bacterium]|nr:F0F1 ATP synthase subunit A [Oscillospiraceae bacterium]